MGMKFNSQLGLFLSVLGLSRLDGSFHSNPYPSMLLTSATLTSMRPMLEIVTQLSATDIS